MIDLEPVIFTKIATALREKFPGIYVLCDYTNAPARFPYVSIVEADNYVESRYLDSGDQEKIARLMYEVNVYSNKPNTKRAECREILNFIDKMMYGMNFTRISMNHVPNIEDMEIYRLNARYECVTDGETMYRK